MKKIFPDITFIYDPNNKINVAYYKKLKQKILDDVDNNNICSGIKSPYVKSSLNVSSFLLVLNGDQPNYGFATVNIRAGGLLEVDLLCSSTKGGGTILINTIKGLMPIYNATEITLNSVKSALGFYTKLGFNHVCVDRTCPMHFIPTTNGGNISKKIRRLKTKIYRGRGRRRGGRKSKSYKKDARIILLYIK